MSALTALSYLDFQIAIQQASWGLGVFTKVSRLFLSDTARRFHFLMG